MDEYKPGRRIMKKVKVRMPDGRVVLFNKVIQLMGAGTNIIPFVDKDTILIAKEFRPAVNKWIYNLAGGTIGRGETPLQNAAHELEEELGYRAKTIKVIGRVYTAPFMTDDVQYFLVATGLKKTKMALEKDEFIKVKRLKFSKAIEMVYSGEINDTTTVAGLLLLWSKMSKKRR